MVAIPFAVFVQFKKQWLQFLYVLTALTVNFAYGVFNILESGSVSHFKNFWKHRVQCAYVLSA